MAQNVLIKNKADQVVSHITDWLRNGLFGIGDKLPPERELAETLGVSLLTVNKAMARLEDASLLSRSAGRGTHVINLPSPGTIAVICDIIHMTRPHHPSYVDLLIEGLLKSAKAGGVIPHFWLGQGRNSEEFLDSLGFRSAAWNNIKGVIAMAWRSGLEDILEARGIPLITICTKHLGKNSVVKDYGQLGRIAAAELARSKPEMIHVVYNEEFDQKFYNSPLPTFKEEIRSQGISHDRLKLIPAELTHQAGFEVGQAIGETASHIFFTDENLCHGFHQWELQHQQQLPKNRHIITQSTTGVKLNLPPDCSRLEFDIDEVSNQAIAMLNEIVVSPAPAAARKVLIKPVLRRCSRDSTT